MSYIKPNLLYYRTAQAVSGAVANLIFGRKYIRNEIKGKKGPFVVIANHQASLDFVNLIGANTTPMSFVISNSFYNTLPVKGFMDKMGVIPKQQFQTAVHDLKRIKEVIDNNGIVVIYPAGLMCEDGLSTPIPAATYKFLKWLNTDVYVARCEGTYFVSPKWGKGFRPGRTFMDIYKLLDKEELKSTDLDVLKEKTDSALLFDAYREQENRKVKYLGCNNISGLENVLYVCPQCKKEFSVKLKDKNTLYCDCGFEAKCNEYGLFDKQPRFVSDWSRATFNDLKEKVQNGREPLITEETEIHMINYKKKKFALVGNGRVSLTKDGFTLLANINGEEINKEISIANTPTLPFKPGKYFELQYGKDIYRCVLNNGKKVMKFINLLKIFYQLNNE